MTNKNIADRVSEVLEQQKYLADVDIQDAVQTIQRLKECGLIVETGYDLSTIDSQTAIYLSRTK